MFGVAPGIGVQVWNKNNWLPKSNKGYFAAQRHWQKVLILNGLLKPAQSRQFV